MKEVPIWEKSNLSLEEAAAYSGIGVNKLRGHYRKLNSLRVNDPSFYNSSHGGNCGSCREYAKQQGFSLHLEMQFLYIILMESIIKDQIK